MRRASRIPIQTRARHPGTCSYFGSYDVDWTQHRWTVHVGGGNIPSFIGADQSRTFELNDDTLVLRDAYRDEAGRLVRTERLLLRAR
jgi:hypothetical protein